MEQKPRFLVEGSQRLRWLCTFIRLSYPENLKGLCAHTVQFFGSLVPVSYTDSFEAKVHHVLFGPLREFCHFFRRALYPLNHEADL